MFPHILILILTILFSDFAFAASDNPYVIPMGESEAQLGNAGFARLGSAASPLFNPAGTIELDKKRITAAGTTYGVLDATIDGQGDDGDLSFSSIITVPNMVSSSRRVGKWSLTYGLFVPVVLEIDAKVPASIPSAGAEGFTVLKTKTEDQYFGIATSRDTGNNWRIGFSLFAYRYNENSLATTQISSSASALYIASTEKFSNEVISAIGILGGLKQFSPNFRAGFRIQLPAVQMYQRSHLYKDTLIVSGGVPTRTTVNATYDTAMDVPADTGAGIYWRYSERGEIYFDSSAQWSGGYRTLQGSESEKRIRLGTTMRFNFGHSYHLNSKTEINFGLIYNPSNQRMSKKVDGHEDSANHFVGLTGGFVSNDDPLRAGIGVYYLKSRTNRDFFGGSPDNKSSMSAFGLTIFSTIAY